MEKLTLKEISGYLPYQLQIKTDNMFQEDIILTLGIELHRRDIASLDWVMRQPEFFKPILYPLEMLTKTIIHNGVDIIPINELKGLYGWTWLWENRNDLSKFNHKAINHCVIEHLQMWHIDYQNLIGQGKAIDKSTLNSKTN